jgi:acetoin utilization deacetylase AcuC-like enzyme
MTGIIVDGTFQAAYQAAQVALTAADILIKNQQQTAFGLCRPPGHHAHEDLCGGYCFFNNAAIATKHLIEEHKVGKVAILDIDYHHGK